MVLNCGRQDVPFSFAIFREEKWLQFKQRNCFLVLRLCQGYKFLKVASCVW